MLGIAVLIVFYGSAVFCLIASIKVMLKYINAPIHLHWELYRGSSIYELSDWQTKTHSTLIDKLKSAVLDGLFLREYYQRNRSFWYFLYLFHIGLYLLILWHVWLFVRAATVNPVTASVWGLVWGHIATALVFIGAVGILIKRMTEEDLKVYYPPIHYAKWLLLIITVAGGFYPVQYYFGGYMSAVLAYVNHQLSFDLQYKIHSPVPTSACCPLDDLPALQPYDETFFQILPPLSLG